MEEYGRKRSVVLMLQCVVHLLEKSGEKKQKSYHSIMLSHFIQCMERHDRFITTYFHSAHT